MNKPAIFHIGLKVSGAVPPGFIEFLKARIFMIDLDAYISWFERFRLTARWLSKSETRNFSNNIRICSYLYTSIVVLV
jgi:hypothetical protein